MQDFTNDNGMVLTVKEAKAQYQDQIKERQNAIVKELKAYKGAAKLVKKSA